VRDIFHFAAISKMVGKMQATFIASRATEPAVNYLLNNKALNNIFWNPCFTISTLVAQSAGRKDLRVLSCPSFNH